MVVFFFGERRMNGASSWISPKRGRLFELRQDHYTTSIISPVFFKSLDHAHPTFEIDFEMISGFKPSLDCQSLFGKPSKAPPSET